MVRFYVRVRLIAGIGAVSCGCALISSTWAAAPSGAAVQGRRVPPARCARTAPARIRSNPWSATRSQLAPRGPDAIRLCRYSGVNASPRLALIRSVLLRSPRLVRELVREFDKLPSQAPGALPPACPLDDGSEIVAQLSYRGDRRVSISVGLQGCNSVTNGTINRLAGGVGAPRPFGPQLVAQLNRLTSTR
jgi:hypothetical protein